MVHCEGPLLVLGRVYGIYSSIWNLFPSRALQHVPTQNFLVKLFNAVKVDVIEKGALRAMSLAHLR